LKSILAQNLMESALMMMTTSALDLLLANVVNPSRESAVCTRALIVLISNQMRRWAAAGGWRFNPTSMTFGGVTRSVARI
jgi:hypothetical protein